MTKLPPSYCHGELSSIVHSVEGRVGYSVTYRDTSGQETYVPCLCILVSNYILSSHPSLLPLHYLSSPRSSPLFTQFLVITLMELIYIHD